MRVSGSRARRWWAGAALALAGVAVALAFLEVALRLFDDRGPSLFVKDTLVGSRYLPGYDGRPWIEEAGRRVHLRFNRLGFRGPDLDLEKATGARRLALLGDSFVAAVGVDEAETLAARLQGSLRRTTGESWEVLSFGVGAYSTAQSLLVWRHFARDFQPDLVVLAFYNGNDLWDNDERLTNFPRPYFRLEGDDRLVEKPLSAAQVRSSNWLNRHSRLYVWQKERIAALRGWWRGAEGTAPPAAPIHDSAPPDPYPDAWRLTEALIAALGAEVQASGARFLLVGIPTHEQVVDEYWEAMLAAVGSDDALRYRRDHADTRLASLAAREGFDFLPLAPAFRAAPDRRDLHFGKGHWNANGNQLAAEEIHRRLAAPGTTALGRHGPR